MFSGKKFGHYEAREKIGAGGMGVVYEGFDSELNRKVAIKILISDFSTNENRKMRFQQEARAASILNHPNIITIYKIGENKHGNFLVTELINGKTLREILRTESLSISRILKITEQIAYALAAAHKANIVHRDIKPENVMIREDGIAKILDFGLAKPISQDLEEIESDVELVKTVPGMVMGSVRYMSPEQARGVEVNERSDIWSLGILLYEMLTKKTPFKGDTTSDTIAALIHKEPESLSKYVQGIPVKLQEIVAKALQKNPDKRYQKAEDFGQDITNLLYNIEHEISIERMRADSAGYDISENPTMIHQTSSTNHPTSVHIDSTKETDDFPPTNKSKTLPIAIFSILDLTVVIGLGFASYNWLNGNKTLAATSFDRIETTKIYANGKVTYPAISPDGKYITYASGDVGNRSLVLRQVSTDSIVTLVQPQERNISRLIFSPDGEFIYYLLTSKDFVLNTLYRIPTLGGTSKKIIEDVDSQVSFSPDGKKITFQRNVSKVSSVLIMTANTDGSNIETLISSTDTKFNTLSQPSWSPKNDVILVRAFDSYGGLVEQMSMVTISFTDKKLKVLGDRNWYQIDNLYWLNDGSGIIFSGKETKESPSQIWQASYLDGKTKAITRDVNNYFDINLSHNSESIIALSGDTSTSLWSVDPNTKKSTQLLPESRNYDGSGGLIETPEGKFIYTRNEGKARNIWSANEKFSTPQKLTDELESVYQLDITPDGKYILFGSRKSGAARIWRMNIDDKTLTQITDAGKDVGHYSPQITNDGKIIIFQEQSSGPNAHTAIKKISIEGGEISTIYDDDEFNVHSIVISPNGKHLVYTSYKKADFDKNVYIVELKEDNTLGELVKEFDADSINSYIWSPDGKSLTILSYRNGTPNLWQLPINGDNAKLQTNFNSGIIFNYIWSNDGKQLYVVRGTISNDLILIRNKN